MTSEDDDENELYHLSKDENKNEQTNQSSDNPIGSKIEFSEDQPLLVSPCDCICHQIIANKMNSLPSTKKEFTFKIKKIKFQMEKI